MTEKISNLRLYYIQRSNNTYIKINVNNKNYFITESVDDKNKDFYQIEINIEEILKDNFILKFEKILKEKKIKKIYFRLNIFQLDLNQYSEALNLLKENNYQTTKIQILKVNLNQDYIELKKNLRRSYKSLINKENKFLQVKFSNDCDNKKKIFEDWREIYSMALLKGDIILNKETYKTLEKAIQQDECLLSVAYDNSKPLGGMLFAFNKNYARYDAAANINEVEIDKSRSVGHYLMWNSIVQLKKMKFNNLEIGSYYNFKLNKDISLNKIEKLNNITNFKKGFGAEVINTNYFFKLFD